MLKSTILANVLSIVSKNGFETIRYKMLAIFSDLNVFTTEQMRKKTSAYQTPQKWLLCTKGGPLYFCWMPDMLFPDDGLKTNSGVQYREPCQLLRDGWLPNKQ